ncbi:MAG: Holliday junction branch migration protein RuvA [bacterium]
MIAFLKGQIINKRKNFLIVEVGGIGYQVFVSPTMYADMITSQAVDLYIHDHVKEESRDLYGFRSLDELEMFELLLSISGVGPKSALGIMAIANIDELKLAIASGDVAMLNKVSGIGKKTAERIVLELREKIATINFEAVGKAGVGSATAQSDEIDALISLGYSLQQARESLKQVDSAIIKSGERIREALKYLAK